MLHDCAFDTARPAPTPEALLQLHEHLTRERHAARVALARTENLLEKLDGFHGAGRGRGGAVAQARPPLLAAADERARAAHRPLLAREGGKTYRGEGRVSAQTPTKARRESVRVDLVGEPRSTRTRRCG